VLAGSGSGRESGLFGQCSFANAYRRKECRLPVEPGGLLKILPGKSAQTGWGDAHRSASLSGSFCELFYWL